MWLVCSETVPAQFRCTGAPWLKGAPSWGGCGAVYAARAGGTQGPAARRTVSWRPGAGKRGRRAQEGGQPRRAQQRRQGKKGGCGTGSARGVRQTGWGAWRTQVRERGSEPRGLLHARRAGRAPFARPGCHGDGGGAQHLRGPVARGRPPARTHAALVGEAESGPGVPGSGASWTERCCYGSAPGRGERGGERSRRAPPTASTSATRRTRSPRCGSRAASKSKSPRQRRAASMSRPTPPATQASNELELEPKWLVHNLPCVMAALACEVPRYMRQLLLGVVGRCVLCSVRS